MCVTEPGKATDVRVGTYPCVRLSTAAGDIVIALAAREAPRTVEAFLRYVDEGRFADVEFARVVRKDNDHGNPRIDVVQTLPHHFESAEPPIPHETTAETGLRHADGAVSLARAASGQSTPGAFFISIGDQAALDFGGARNADGLGFAVFGQIVEGMEVVRAMHARVTRPDAPSSYLLGQMLAEPVAIFGARREAQGASDRLADLAEDYWQFKAREYPFEATNTANLPNNARLSGGRIADHERRSIMSGHMLKRARAIPANELGPEDAITLDLLIGQLTTLGEAWDLGDHLTPKLYPFGFTEIPVYLAASTSLKTLRDYEDFVARLSAVPDFFAGHLEMLRHANAQGYRLPRILLPRVRGLIEAQIAKGGFGSTVRDRFADRPAGIDASAFAHLFGVAERILAEEINPALERLLVFFDATNGDLLRDTVSICDQPNGNAYYRFRVLQQTTTGLDPDEIHTLGLEEVAAIQRRILEILADAGFDGDARAYGQTLEQTCVAPSAEALLERARAVAKQIDGRLPRLFGRMPRVTYGVESFSPAQSRQRPIAMAQAAPADRSLPGVFWLTALPERCPTHLLIPLTLHEAWPGHLMQFALAHELERLPAFRRQSSFDYNAYIEGWALYCEQLGFELGLYGDPRDRFGQAINDLWRAARLVVDTGLHWKGWSRDEAITYLQDHSFLPADTVAAEVDRYIGMPAQALSYKIGEHAIRELRAEAESRLSDAFSLRDFHDAVLETGAVSLDVLRRHIAAWIEENRSEPH